MRKIILSVFVIAMFFLSTTSVRAQDAVIEEGKTVKINYTLTVNGEVVDSSEGMDPLEYIHGEGMIISGLEKQLLGLKAGDKKTVSVAAEEAYGPIDPNGFVEIPKENLPTDPLPEAGMVLQMMTPEGYPLMGIITEVKPDVAVINFNHPLAGENLLFDIEIMSVE